jgi:hypothetical protein
MWTALPDKWEPFVFPPLTVSPNEMVSSNLIGSILAQDGLIYLQGGFSAQSFWVAFERDYALRAGKPVYSFNPDTSAFERDHSAPLGLPAFASYSRQDRSKVRQIATVMARERFVDIWVDAEQIAPGTLWAEEITRGMDNRIQRGGYAILFLSQIAIESRWVQREVENAGLDRVLIAIMDGSDEPSDIPAERIVRLVEEPNGPINMNRLDDLIVRLYWLIYQNTRQNRLD